MMKVWNMVLVSSTFFLCIFGTFLTRSGIVQSVHAFSEGPIGKYFVGFMAISISYLGFAVAGFITMIILLRAVEKSGWVFSIALAFISVVVVVWLFGRVLGMTLPRGPWGW